MGESRSSPSRGSLLFWGLGVAVFAFAQAQSAIKPNSPFVLRSTEWMMCGVAEGEQRVLATGPATGRGARGAVPAPLLPRPARGVELSAFNAWMYSLDTMFPVLGIGQKEYWRPDTTKRWGSSPWAISTFRRSWAGP